MKTRTCYETHMHCHGDYCDQVNAYVDRERKELADALRGMLAGKGLHSVGCHEWAPGYDDSKCCPVHIAHVVLAKLK